MHIVYKTPGGLMKGLLKDVLIALNIFILFLLIFEGRFLVPFWLQPFGRMHPMLLHFPIVLMILGMVLEFFRFKKNNDQQPVYKLFADNILIAGILLSGVTVVMGLFLSKEEGYESDALLWHKWTGVAVFFAGSLIYLLNTSSWYTSLVARSAAVFTIIVIVAAGHFGASITHGDNYVFEPLKANETGEQVVLEDARVFDHMIMPIFQDKCISCHNPRKLKGELLLTDTESIIKGGKSGDFIVPGKPEISLMLQRIHLPENDKKHMPPKGKAQLTEDEIRLLELWVQSNADFKNKVVDLPENDTIRLLAEAQFRSLRSIEEVYDFEEADEDLVAKLNNDYRVIQRLAKNSPALSVNIFNSSEYDSKKISELLVIKNQVVDLSLNRMPVTDADLKIISQFTNLRTLNLNFTSITGSGLKNLAPLTNLKQLLVSGTSMTLTVLQQQLPLFKNLQQVAVWNCGLSVPDVAQLKKDNREIEFLTGYVDDGSNPIRLNAPTAESSKRVFTDSLVLVLKHRVKGTEIRYTTDGSDPDSTASSLFPDALSIKNNVIIKAKAFKKGWLGSHTATFGVYKSRFVPDTSFMLAGILGFHNNRPVKTLSDGNLGEPVTSAGGGIPIDEKWIGFSGKMEIVVQFNEAHPISSVSLNAMINESLVMYPPTLIQILAGENLQNLKAVGKLVNNKLPVKGSEPEIKSFDVTFPTMQAKCVKIVATIPTSRIDGEANPRPFLLLDEIMIN